MLRGFVRVAAVTGMLAVFAGCVNVDTRIPDVQINTGSVGEGGGPRERRTPYARDLEKVLDQERTVQKDLKDRDWEELDDDSADWSKYVRKLMGQANTCGNPAKMREYCTSLLREIEGLQRAAAAKDGKAAGAALTRMRPILDRMSAEFPLVEPAAPPGGTGAAKSGKSSAAAP